jgi:hypothetical protein
MSYFFKKIKTVSINRVALSNGERWKSLFALEGGGAQLF